MRGGHVGRDTWQVDCGLSAKDFSQPQPSGERDWVDAPAVGGELERGSRPVLVVSPAEFNAATKLPVICPIARGGDYADGHFGRGPGKTRTHLRGNEQSLGLRPSPKFDTFCQVDHALKRTST